MSTPSSYAQRAVVVFGLSSLGNGFGSLGLTGVAGVQSPPLSRSQHRPHRDGVRVQHGDSIGSGFLGSGAAVTTFEETYEALRGHRDVTFYLYEPSVYEPRFEGSLSNCKRKGADYMFVEQLVDSKYRVMQAKDAEVVVVPCLFESYRRCTTTNHAEQPPSLMRVSKSNPHPEDVEEVPWTKPWDADTATCLQSVMSSDVYKATSGYNHLWVAADWAMNFGRTIEQTTFKNMTIGRIEVVDEQAAEQSNRSYALDQSWCSVVVPYASDVAYAEDFSYAPSFAEWKKRSELVSFRFEDRRYVLFCKGSPCEGAKEATGIRHQSLDFRAKLEAMGHLTSIAMERAPLSTFIQELHGSQFCLVMIGDTPSSHSLYDALAASCIPILVSDRWNKLAKPFAHGRRGETAGNFPYENFMLQIGEDTWRNDMDSVVAKVTALAKDEKKVEAYFTSMMHYRRQVLWSMPGDGVSRALLRAAKKCVSTS